LGDSKAYLQKAFHALDSHAELSALNLSSIYKSKPHGPQDQPDYFNAVVKFETKLPAETLLDLLQSIENENKRVRKGVVRWGARTLDLDLLFYGDEKIETKRLSVPHPRICERAFVLLPLRDLLAGDIADLKINAKTTIKDCIDKLSTASLNDIKEIETTHD
jgi:2-amino-4-hydroxy-6-hydroxymethyldihydropteridine diphosphokinase